MKQIKIKTRSDRIGKIIDSTQTNYLVELDGKLEWFPKILCEEVEIEQTELFPQNDSVTHSGLRDWELENLSHGCDSRRSTKGVSESSKPSDTDSFPVYYSCDSRRSTTGVSESKKRFCNTSKLVTESSVSEYAPTGSARSHHLYFRFSYRLGNKVKHLHIPGGNTTSGLAIFNANQIREMIRTGATIDDIKRAIALFSRGRSKGHKSP